MSCRTLLVHRMFSSLRRLMLSYRRRLLLAAECCVALGTPATLDLLTLTAASVCPEPYQAKPTSKSTQISVNSVYDKCMVFGGRRVVRCRTRDREVMGSNPTNGYCVPTPTQHAIPLGSVNDYQRKLGSKRAYHTMHWPRIHGLAASTGVRLRAKETEISAAPWALRLGERTLLYFTYMTKCIHT